MLDHKTTIKGESQKGSHPMRLLTRKTRNQDRQRRRLVLAASVLAGSAVFLASMHATTPAVASFTPTQTVKTWGFNLYHQLGYDTLSQQQQPTPLNLLPLNQLPPDQLLPRAISETGVTGIEGGSGHSIALISGHVWAWGRNYEGELGNGTTGGAPNANPVEVQTDATHVLTGITTIAAGSYHNLATDGTSVWAWGSNSSGQLGNGNTTDSGYAIKVQTDATPTYLSGGITAIAAGNNHSLAIQSGKVLGWGNNQENELGDNSTTDRHFPVRVQDSTTSADLANVTDIAAGHTHSLAVDSSGYVWGWGNAHQGQVGDHSLGVDTPPATACFCRSTAVHVNDGAGNLNTGSSSALAWPLHRVSAGSFHSVVLRSDGTAWAWGSDNVGQLGVGNPRVAGLRIGYPPAGLPTPDPCTCSAVAVQVQVVAFQSPVTGAVALTGIQSVSAGGDHTVALGTGDSHTYAYGNPGYAWGDDGDGPLGDGTTGDPTCRCRQYAVRILSLENQDQSSNMLVGASALAAGGAHSLAVVG